MKRNLAPFLPHELIVEILLRLPVKSLLRFKTVCKLWLSIISDPQFAERYFDLTGPRLLLRPTDYNSIDSLDIEASLDNDSATVHLHLPTPSFPFFFDDLVIMGSCRGLMLLNYEEDGDLFLWNPLIGIHKSIANYFYGCIYNFMYGFGYDASTNDYLVVLLDLGYPEIPEEFPTEVNFFSFKTNSWNDNIKYPNVRYRDLGNQFKAGSLLNDALHWLVLGFYDDREVLVIISFDLIQRSFSEIPLPCHLTKEPKFEIYSLRVLGGCLSVCCYVQDDAACEIWVMKEYKVHSSWTKSFVLRGFDLPYNRFPPICVTKDGGILGSNVNGRLEKHNEKGELLEHLTFPEAQQLYGGNPQCAVYRGRLVSLPSNLGRAMPDDQQ